MFICSSPPRVSYVTLLFFFFLVIGTKHKICSQQFFHCKYYIVNCRHYISQLVSRTHACCIVVIIYLLNSNSHFSLLLYPANYHPISASIDLTIFNSSYNICFSITGLSYLAYLFQVYP